MLNTTGLKSFCSAIVLLTFICSGPLSVPESLARDQTEDVVYFTDGSSFKGTIVDINRNRIRIKQKDGRVFDFPTKDIYKFSSSRHFREIYRQSLEQNR